MTAIRDTRVIVVGHTALAGVDAALRKQQGIELIRARTAMSAIGEAGSPIDEGDHRSGGGEAGDLTVIVSPEALSDSRSRSFVEAIRRIDASARLLCVGEHTLDGFDAAIGSRPEAAGLSDQVRHAPAKAETPRPDAPTPDKPVAGAATIATTAGPDTAAVMPAAPEPSNPAGRTTPEAVDSGPAAALATGRDPVAAALQQLSRRWNLAEARLAAPGEQGLPVVFNGREVAQLVTRPALPESAAAREGEMLAPWVVLARQQDQLRHAAFTDELTGAWNRRYFNRFLAAAIASATEKRHTVTLLVFDIDNFKLYNDRFGHAAGDEILVESVKLLNTCIRATDRVCRIGGDEFAVIFHDPAGPRSAGGAPSGAAGPTSPQSIGDVVRRFQKAICGHQFPKLAELAPGTLTISGGMATFPWDGRTVQQLLDRADALAMRSKQEGKNKVTFGPGAEQVCELGGSDR